MYCLIAGNCLLCHASFGSGSHGSFKLKGEIPCFRYTVKPKGGHLYGRGFQLTWQILTLPVFWSSLRTVVCNRCFETGLNAELWSWFWGAKLQVKIHYIFGLWASILVTEHDDQSSFILLQLCTLSYANIARRGGGWQMWLIIRSPGTEGGEGGDKWAVCNN